MTNQKISFHKISSFKKDEIRMLFKTAHTRYRQQGLIVKLAPKKGDYARILVVTPKKSGNAPQRNLIRRRLKNIFFTEELYSSSYDWLFLISSESIQLSFDMLKNIIKEIQLKDHVFPH